MTQLTASMLGVQIPDRSNGFFIRNNVLYYEIDRWREIDSGGCDLPPGSWSILGTAKDGVPEFECYDIVEKRLHPIFKNTLFYRVAGNAWFNNPQKAVSRYLHSCGCGVGRWVILINDKNK